MTQATISPLSLATLAKVVALATEGPLVDLAFFRAREGHAVVLELDHRGGGFTAHVLNGVLVTCMRGRGKSQPPGG